MAWLNSEITWAANEGSDSLLNVIREKVDRFNAINVATALHRLARLGDSKALAENEAFQSLVQKTSSVLGLSLTQCDAKAVSTIAHAVASLGLRDVSVASGVVVASLARVHDFDRQGIANVAWALAKMPKVKGRLKLAKKLAMRSQQFLMEFSPQELCNVLWALGKLGVRDNKLMSLASDAARSKLENFTPQGLSMLAASYARVGVFNETLLEQIRSKAEAQLPKLNSRDAAQLVWSHAKFKLCNETFLDKLCKHAATLPLEGNELLVSFLWSFGTLRWVPNRKLLKAIVTQATEKASSFGAHRSVRLLTALAKLAFLDQSVELGDLTAALAANIQLLHMRMGAQEVGISAWALATLKPKGWRKILRGLVARAGEEEVFGDLNWWSAAHLEYALRVASKVRGSLPRQEPQDAHDFLSKLSSLSANEVAQIRQDSKEFQERPLKVAAELQPWKGHPPCTVLIFGAQRHIRPALQQAGFTTTIWRRFASGSSTAKEWPQLEAEAEAAAIRYPDSSESFEFALHAVASSLAEGAPLWVYGDVREGVLSTTRSIKGLFTLSAIHEDGDCRVVSATRSRRKLQDTFESQLRVESIDFGHGLQDWWSVPGLFAAGRVDVMSQYLLDTMTYVRSKMAASNEKTWQLLDTPCNLLDFASGTGVLAAGAAKIFQVKSCWLMDADAAAMAAAKKNLPEAKQILADGFRCELPEARFNLIISNPPVHNGHADDLSLLLELLREGPLLLEPGGEMWLVTQEHIPTGRLFQMALKENEDLGKIDGSNLRSLYETVGMYPTSDGRFVVWRACLETNKRKSSDPRCSEDQEDEKPKRPKF